MFREPPVAVPGLLCGSTNAKTEPVMSNLAVFIFILPKKR
jgi:hypothetical protein